MKAVPSKTFLPKFRVTMPHWPIARWTTSVRSVARLRRAVHAQTSTPSADALTSACRILFTIHRSVTMDSGDVDVETVAELIQRLRSKHLN
jgi:hypothetical protein